MRVHFSSTQTDNQSVRRWRTHTPTTQLRDKPVAPGDQQVLRGGESQQRKNKRNESADRIQSLFHLTYLHRNHQKSMETAHVSGRTSADARQWTCVPRPAAFLLADIFFSKHLSFVSNLDSKESLTFCLSLWDVSLGGGGWGVHKALLSICC